MTRHMLLFVVLGSVAASIPPANASEPPVQADMDPEGRHLFRLATDPVYRQRIEAEEGIEPIPNLAKYKQAVQNIGQVPTEKLPELKAALGRIRERAFKKWKYIERLIQRSKLATVTYKLRLATHTLRCFELKNERDARVAEIHQRENEAYLAQFPGDDPPHSNLGSPNPRDFAEWQKTAAYRRFRQEEQAVEMWLAGEYEKVLKEANSGWSEAERQIDRLRHEVLGEYRFIVEAVRTVQEEIERREAGRQRQQQIEERIKGLKFRTNADSLIRMKVGEVKEIWFWIEKGAPQYRINVQRPEKKDAFLLTHAERAGPIMLPFSFREPGRYVRHLQVVDRYAETATVTLTFDLSEDAKPPEPPEPPPSGKDPPAQAKPPAKQTPSKLPTNPPPPTVSPKPITSTMLTGRFHARLWDASSGPGWLRSSDYSYTPLIVSIDPNGAISGKANYDLPLDHFNPGWAQRRTAYSQNLRFTLDGFTDPTSGKTTIKLTEGRRELHHVQKGNNRRIEQIMEFNTTLQGWRAPSPRDEDLLANAYIDGMGRTGQAQKQKDFPNIGAGQDGKPAFVQKGFFNHMGIDPQFEPGTYHVTKNVNYWQNESEAGAIDDLKSTGPTKTPVGAWFLEILGPADDDDSSDRELLLLAIWPRSPVRCTGNTVQLTANAVYSDKVFEAVNVTDRATWRQTPGLRPAKGTKGRFELTQSAYDEQGRPRSQYVRAGIRKGIDWTADTVKVVPTAPSQVQIGEQPESPE